MGLVIGCFVFLVLLVGYQVWSFGFFVFCCVVGSCGVLILLLDFCLCVGVFL